MLALGHVNVDEFEGDVLLAEDNCDAGRTSVAIITIKLENHGWKSIGLSFGSVTSQNGFALYVQQRSTKSMNLKISPEDLQRLSICCCVSTNKLNSDLDKIK